MPCWHYRKIRRPPVRTGNLSTPLCCCSCHRPWMPTQPPSPDILYRRHASRRWSGRNGPLLSSLAACVWLASSLGGGVGASDCFSPVALIHSPCTSRALSISSPMKSFDTDLTARATFGGTDCETVALTTCECVSIVLDAGAEHRPARGNLLS
jgi:hypothetical protein